MSVNKFLKTIKNGGRKDKNKHAPDKKLLISVAVLIFLGLLMLASASAVASYSKFGSSYHYLKNQALPLFLGIVLFYLFSRIHFRFWRNNAILFLFLSIFFLLLVFIPGLRSEQGTSYSWITIFGRSLQPSEFVKLFFLIYLASWLEAKISQVKSLREVFLPFVFVLGIVGFLMYKQPDLGTLSVIAASSLVVLFVSGVQKKYIFVFLAILGLALYGIVSTNEYQALRFKCAFDRDFSVNDSCYQINQSLIAFGSGGFWGRGLGQSRQKFLYLPEVSCDAIFPIVSEEIGFLFSAVFLGLYLFIFYRIFLIAKRSDDLFAKFLSIGIGSWIMIQVFLNIGGMIALVPMTGVPLPFVSAGGSAILSLLMAMGILVNISKYNE